jgi:hypothetical protein
MKFKNLAINIFFITIMFFCFSLNASAKTVVKTCYYASGSYGAVYDVYDDLSSKAYVTKDQKKESINYNKWNDEDVQNWSSSQEGTSFVGKDYYNANSKACSPFALFRYSGGGVLWMGQYKFFVGDKVTVDTIYNKYASKEGWVILSPTIPTDKRGAFDSELGNLSTKIDGNYTSYLNTKCDEGPTMAADLVTPCNAILTTLATDIDTAKMKTKEAEGYGFTESVGLYPGYTNLKKNISDYPDKLTLIQQRFLDGQQTLENNKTTLEGIRTEEEKYDCANNLGKRDEAKCTELESQKDQIIAQSEEIKKEAIANNVSIALIDRDLKDLQDIAYGLEGCKLIPDRLMNLLKTAFNYIKIIVPILLLVFGTVDFSKAVISGDKDALTKAGKDFTKRVLIAMLIFFLPILLELLLGLIDKKETLCEIK